MIILVVSLSVAGCANQPEKLVEVIKSQELALQNQNISAEYKEQAQILLANYLEFALKFSDHCNAEVYLYKAAMIQADVLKNFDACISSLERLQRNYPHSEKAEQAMFLVAYTYAEELGNYDKARMVYESFIDKYPKSELMSSAQFELENLGKPVQELDIFKKTEK